MIIFAVSCCLATATSPLAVAAAPASDPAPLFTTEECQGHPWIIGFDQDRWQVNEFAQHRLDSLARAFAADPSPLLVSGRIDWPESADRGLARRRIDTVVHELAQRGIPQRAVWTRDDGTANPIVANDHAEPDPQNRIVLITLPNEGASCARKLARSRVTWLRLHCSNSATKSDPSCDAIWSALGQN